MINRTLLSILFVSLWGYSSLFAENSEYIWSFDEETPSFTEGNLQNPLGEKKSTPSFVDAADPSMEDSEWETGWELYLDSLPIAEVAAPPSSAEATEQEIEPQQVKPQHESYSFESFDYGEIKDTASAAGSPPQESHLPEAKTTSVTSFPTPPLPLESEIQPYIKISTHKPRQSLINAELITVEAIASNEREALEATEAQTPELPPAPDQTIAQADDEDTPAIPPPTVSQLKTPPKTILINFNNVSMIEYIRFISRITNKNFVFNESELQFNVTIISEEPTPLDNVMTALIQELQIHGLSLIEQENGFIIHKNPDIRSVPKVNTNGTPIESPREFDLITQVFKLNTLDPDKASDIATPLLSTHALIETSKETQHIIITDLVTNIEQIAAIFKSIDAPNSGLVIGQYVVRNTFMDTLITLAQQIMAPIAQDQPLTLVPHPTAQSIFIVSSSFLVERTISVLQHLDTSQGATRIYNLDELKFQKITPPTTPPGVTPETRPPTGILPEGAVTPTEPTEEVEQGRWELNPQGDRIFRPGSLPKQTSPTDLPQGDWTLDPQGNWYFLPAGAPAEGLKREGLDPGEAPSGRWKLGPDGNWYFELSPEESLQPERLRRATKLEEELPVGHIERTKFFIHKLEFRKGEDIVEALQRIGESLQIQGTSNAELATSIQSVQWLEASNALVVTGTEGSIEKIKELIEEIDKPLRQVFIEMLILQTSLQESMTYGVTWGTRSGGGTSSTAQAFLGGASPLSSALDGAGQGGAIGIPDTSTLVTSAGYHLGIIGQKLSNNGTTFATLGAFIEAIHSRETSNILLNPKIVTEDNKPAELFVGFNTRYQTQAVSNDEGSVITNNFEFRDVGTTLKVTPLIGRGDIITLEIYEEHSRNLGDPTSGQGGGGTRAITEEIEPGPTTSIHRTSTIVHVPDKYFVILSGMIDDQKSISRNQLPCLGGVPIIGAANKRKATTDTKTNVMIFIRPQIIDTEEDFNKLTRQQQEIIKQKTRLKKSWKYQVDEALEFMNLKPSCCDECE